MQGLNVLKAAVLILLGSFSSTCDNRITAHKGFMAVSNQRKREYDMNSQEQIASRFLNLTHEQFFGDDESFLGDIKWRLVDTDLRGLAINSPKVVTTDTTDQLPVVMATCKTGLRGWEVRQKQNCILVSVERETDTVHFGEVFMDIKEKTSRAKLPEEKREKPDPSSLAAAVAGAYRFDARRVGNIPWEPGKIALSVISYDWVSNTVEVELKAKEQKEPSDIIPKEVTPAPNPNAGATEKWLFGLLERDKQVFPSYVRNSKTPQPPAGQGLSFTIENPGKAGGRLLTCGAFVLKAESRYLPEMRISHKYADGQTRTVSAVVPMTFAIVGLDWPKPVRFDWAVPVYSDKQVQAGEPIYGYFTIDVLAGSEIKLEDGNYAAYIIMDGITFGPRKFQWSASD
jgi:hypothetical protein